MYQLLAVSSFRKDRFVAAANRFVLNVMGPHFYSETEMDLAKIVEEEVRTKEELKLSLPCLTTSFIFR